MEKEVSEVDRKLFLRKTYLDKIYYHINRNPINQDELYSLIRKFFGEYLKLDYEFTYEELSQELNKVFVTPKVKEHIDDFLIRLSESEYLEETILGTNEINKYLEEFGDIIKNIIYDDQPVHGEESIVQKVLKRRKEQPKIMDVAGITALIEETNFHITNGNMDIAKSSYINLLKAYDALNKDDKKKLHDNLNEVYERLQTLIKNPSSQTQSDKKTIVNNTVSDSIKKVRDLADDTSFYINASNAESAKKKYSETLNLYESLNPEDKKIMHSRVNDLYTQLQAMLSVTTYIDSESVSADDSNKNLHEDQSVMDNNNSGNVALNLDLSTISGSSSMSSASGASNIGGAAQASNTLSGNFEANSRNEILNMDLPTASDAYSSTSSITAAEDNSLFIPSMSATDNSSSIIQSNSDNMNETFEKAGSKLVAGEMDYTVYNDSNTNSGNGLSAKEDAKASNVLFTSNVLSESSKITAQEVSKKSSTLSMIRPISKMDEVSKSAFKPNASVPFVTSQNNIIQTASQQINPIPSTQKKIASLQTTSQTASIPIKIAVARELVKSGQPQQQEHIASSISSSTTGKIESVNAIKIDSEKIRGTTAEDTSNLKTLGISPINIPTSIPSSMPSNILKPLSAGQAIQPSRPFVQPIIQPMIQSKLQQSIPSTIEPAVDKLNRILKKIDDDIILDRFDKAKSSYKEALLFYRSVSEANKAKCYEHFYATFKRLDNALHQKSLHDILEKHLLDAEESHRPISLASDVNLNKQHSGNANSESARIIKMTTLPVMLANNPDMTRVYELIEESYFNIDNEHSDLAMLKYFKALGLYHQLPIMDKKKLYSNLYELFKKLSISKKVG